MKPNVLVIFADQMRADTMGCAGHPLIKTPNLDRLAREGIHFQRAYSPDPICVPARASFTTGNYPHKCTGSKNNSGRIRDDQIKIAELFGQNGYRTYASGKLHYVPYSPPGTPRLLHGFQRCALHESGRIIQQFGPDGTVEGLEDYHDYLNRVGWGGYGRAHGLGNNDIHPAPAPMPAEHYVDAWVCSRALEFLGEHRRDHAGKPWFMFMSFPKPHAPYDPPRPYDTLYDPREVPVPFRARETERQPRTPTKQVEKKTHGWDLWSPQMYQVARAHYYGQVTFQDLQIGRMLTYLEETEQLANTVIVYTADHGDLLGDFGFFAKSSFYRGSVDIPLIVHWPMRLQRGLRPDALVGLQDLLPTLAELASIPLPQPVDGMDLSNLLEGRPFQRREFYVSYCMSSPNQLYMVADAYHKYLYSQVGPYEELYDLVHDPDELTNIAVEPRAETTLKLMRRRLREWALANGETQIIDGDSVAQAPDIDPNAVDFRPNTMGWRWY